MLYNITTGENSCENVTLLFTRPVVTGYVLIEMRYTLINLTKIYQRRYYR